MIQDLLLPDGVPYRALGKAAFVLLVLPALVGGAVGVLFVASFAWERTLTGFSRLMWRGYDYREGEHPPKYRHYVSAIAVGLGQKSPSKLIELVRAVRTIHSEEDDAGGQDGDVSNDNDGNGGNDGGGGGGVVRDNTGSSTVDDVDVGDDRQHNEQDNTVGNDDLDADPTFNGRKDELRGEDESDGPDGEQVSGGLRMNLGEDDEVADKGTDLSSLLPDDDEDDDGRRGMGDVGRGTF